MEATQGGQMKRLVRAFAVAVILAATAGQVTTNVYIDCSWFPWAIECWFLPAAPTTPVPPAL